jgi:acetyltransferase-like isoleucine patch superfamily enzyme
MVEVISNAKQRIDPSVKLIGSGILKLGDNAQIRAYTVIEMDGTLTIGDNTVIGYHNFIQCSGEMTIGEGTLIGPSTVLLASSHKITDILLYKEKIHKSTLNIGNNVWIGSNVTIQHGIFIGNNAIIGANSFVNKNVSPNSIVGGVPAKHIRDR